MKRILSVLCIAAALCLPLAGCGGDSGGDDPPALTPASFAGSWFGERNDDYGTPFTFQIDVDSAGNITNIYINGSAQNVTGTITADPGYSNLFDFQLSDTTVGYLMPDGTAGHLVYVDQWWYFGVLQKNATSLPSYADTDVIGAWSGYTLQTNSDFSPVDAAASNVTVASDWTFSGTGLGGGFTGNIPSSWAPDFGAFKGTLNADEIMIHLSPDKMFAGGFTCGSMLYQTFPACAFYVWAK